MRFKISTKVQNSLNEIIPQFNQDLFQKLSPPFPPAKLHRFDGCKLGDQFIIELNFFKKFLWEGEVTKEELKENTYLFVDEGRVLPFGMKKWVHHHWMIKNAPNETTILDDVEFTSGNLIWDIFLFIGFYGMMVYRKPLYKKYLSQKAS